MSPCRPSRLLHVCPRVCALTAAFRPRCVFGENYLFSTRYAALALPDESFPQINSITDIMATPIPHNVPKERAFLSPKKVISFFDLTTAPRQLSSKRNSRAPSVQSATSKHNPSRIWLPSIFQSVAVIKKFYAFPDTRVHKN